MIGWIAAMALRKMAVSVATGRVSAVFLEDGAVVGVKRLRLETKTTQNAAKIIGSWIRGFRPDHMITEDPKTALETVQNFVLRRILFTPLGSGLRT